MTLRITLVALVCAAGCTNVTELADWSGDGGTGTDTDLPDVIAMDCTGCAAVGGEVSNLLCAIDLCDGSYVLAGGNTSDYHQVTTYRSVGMPCDCTVDDTRAAVIGFGDPSNDLEPKLNGSYAIMATGDWDVEYHSTSCSPYLEEDSGTESLEYDDAPGKESDVMYDAVEWTLQLRAPHDAHAFSFDYVFFSVEYEEVLPWGSDFNDKFYAVLDAASTNGGMATVINYTACRDADVYSDFTCSAEMALEQPCTQNQKYCYIAINSALSECCNYECSEDNVNAAETSIDGTGYECAPSFGEDGAAYGSSTGWLHTVWRIEPDEEFTLTFHIHDTADSTRDSAVILDRFQFRRSFQAGGTIIIE
jgi:hypothetical protein